MQILKYNICTRINKGTEDSPAWEDFFTEKTLSYCEENEEIAKKEAYNGEYTIEDDGQPEPAPSSDDVLNALLGVI